MKNLKFEIKNKAAAGRDPNFQFSILIFNF